MITEELKQRAREWLAGTQYDLDSTALITDLLAALETAEARSGPIDMPARTTEHDALEDARHQAIMAIAAWRKIHCE